MISVIHVPNRECGANVLSRFTRLQGNERHFWVSHLLTESRQISYALLGVIPLLDELSKVLRAQ